ncbi:MAG: hypothetical protein QW112_02560, partial [Candidatus Micrarchaeia archaeon]
MLSTKIDALAEMAKQATTMADAAARLGMKIDTIDFISHVMEKERIFSVTYPAVGSPRVNLVKVLPPPTEVIPKKFDEKVSFEVSGLPVDVYIYRDTERRPFYHVYYPKPGSYTAAFLE